jgi:homogentisate 1,2-dioxygenase
MAARDAKRARVDSSTSKALEYMSGFGNSFSSEAMKGALPAVGNSPQKVGSW